MIYGLPPYYVIIGMFAIPVILGFWLVSFNGKLYTGQKMWRVTALLAFATAAVIYTVHYHDGVLPHGMTSIGWSALGLFLLAGILGFTPLMEWWMELRAEMFRRGVTSRKTIRDTIRTMEGNTGIFAVLRDRHEAAATTGK